MTRISGSDQWLGSVSANLNLSSGDGRGPSSSPHPYAGPERQYAAADKILSKKLFLMPRTRAVHGTRKSRAAFVEDWQPSRATGLSLRAEAAGSEGGAGRARRHRHRRSSAHGFAPSLHQGVEMPWPYVRSKTRGRFCACCGRGFLQTWLDCPNISHCVYRQFKKSLLAILTSQKEVHFSRSGVSDLTTAFSKSSLEAAI